MTMVTKPARPSNFQDCTKIAETREKSLSVFHHLPRKNRRRAAMMANPGASLRHAGGFSERCAAVAVGSRRSNAELNQTINSNWCASQVEEISNHVSWSTDSRARIRYSGMEGGRLSSACGPKSLEFTTCRMGNSLSHRLRRWSLKSSDQGTLP